MKRFAQFFSLIMALIIAFMLVGCNSSDKEENTGSDKRVLEAIDELAEYWGDEYSKNDIEDTYLKIVNTRIINIKDNIDIDDMPRAISLFDGVDYIVEFELLSNFLGTSPYYSNICMNNCVIVYKDSTVKVSKNLFDIYRSMTFTTDFSPIIESIKDFGGDYDGIVKIK